MGMEAFPGEIVNGNQKFRNVSISATLMTHIALCGGIGASKNSDSQSSLLVNPATRLNPYSVLSMDFPNGWATVSGTDLPSAAPSPGQLPRATSNQLAKHGTEQTSG
jgi:hypothetical protein